MSAGDFQRSKYQSREGNIYRIRIQPETLGLTLGGTANSEPTGAIDQVPVSTALVPAKSKSGILGRCRMVTAVSLLMYPFSTLRFLTVTAVAILALT